MSNLVPETSAATWLNAFGWAALALLTAVRLVVSTGPAPASPTLQTAAPAAG